MKTARFEVLSTPVFYGTVSTIANMRLGTVALGAVEMGLITAASAQLARHDSLPCRSAGSTTESKSRSIEHYLAYEDEAKQDFDAP